MAQTTTHLSAKDNVFLLAGVDISGSSGYVRIQPTQEVGRTSTFSGTSRIKTPGKLDWTVEFRLTYTETAGEAFATWWTAYTGGAAVAFATRPKGTGGGNYAFTGSIIITDADIPLDSDSPDPVVVSGNAEGTGALAWASQ